MHELGCSIEAHSLWGGKPVWNGISIRLFSKVKLLSLLFWIPFWALSKPEAFTYTLRALWSGRCGSLQNFNETFLALGFALVESANFQKQNISLIHGIWATMPATAAFAIHKLTGIPFSMGAHAYDLFRTGGDWLLDIKLKDSAFVRTSSNSSATRLRNLGLAEGKIKLIRRGLATFTGRSDYELISSQKLNLVAIGRLVPKKGYFYLLKVALLLQKQGISFELKIVGDGFLRKRIATEIQRTKLSQNVFILGSKSEAEVQEILLQSDALLFTGIVDANGDRDGIPNVIPEAMNAGCLVLSSARAGASEAFIDGVSGFSLDPRDIESWVDLLTKLRAEPARFVRIRKKAVQHVRENFDIRKTAASLKKEIQKVASDLTSDV